MLLLLQVNAGAGMIVPPKLVGAVELRGVDALSVTLIENAAVWAVVKVPVMLAVVLAVLPAGVNVPSPDGTVPVVTQV